MQSTLFRQELECTHWGAGNFCNEVKAWRRRAKFWWKFQVKLFEFIKCRKIREPIAPNELDRRECERLSIRGIYRRSSLPPKREPSSSHFAPMNKRPVIFEIVIMDTWRSRISSHCMTLLLTPRITTPTLLAFPQSFVLVTGLSTIFLIAIPHETPIFFSVWYKVEAIFQLRATQNIYKDSSSKFTLDISIFFFH